MSLSPWPAISLMAFSTWTVPPMSMCFTSSNCPTVDQTFFFRLIITLSSKGIQVNIFPSPLYVCDDRLGLDIVGCYSWKLPAQPTLICLCIPPWRGSSKRFLECSTTPSSHLHNRGGFPQKQFTSPSVYFLDRSRIGFFLWGLATFPPEWLKLFLAIPAHPFLSGGFELIFILLAVSSNGSSIMFPLSKFLRDPHFEPLWWRSL